MNKIVCNVCGTSYPDNASQCPICGYVQTAEKSSLDNTTDSKYTYVKGGRFSKSNVKKRNLTKTKQAPVKTQKKHSKKNKSNVGSMIIIVLLLLAIIAVAGYIVLRFFVPNDFLYEGLGGEKQPSASLEAPEPESATLPTTEATEPPTEALNCTAIQLDSEKIQLDGIGSTHKLSVTLEPANTPDEVSYVSSDETVATVDDSGTITVIGPGNAVITASCGSVSAECAVQCSVPDEEVLELNRKEITFKTEGETWLLYDGDIPDSDIVWSSDNNQVAVIISGKVVAVGNGDTIVYGVYKDQSTSCVIHCKFEGDAENENGITEAGSDSTKTYRLYNPYGYADDVTINVGENFILKLVDEALNEPDDVEWKVKNEGVCSFSNNVVRALNSGTTEITATYAGKTYTCLVRVN